MLALLLAAAFQCPDGSPPPCTRTPTAPAAAPSIDPHRIAVLPFRVTTADSLLGEGLAELIATEFTGENSPRAVNMGTVLRSWRTAGGGLRSPLAQERAIRLARDMGAGSYVEGSVVGLGSRLTINASVVTVPGGEARRAAPVSGSADSLDVLVGRVASGLLASAGTREPSSRVRLTDSPAAMRAYLAGLRDWRASHLNPAAEAFERAIAEDTTFVRAMFMRWAVGQWGVPSPPGLETKLFESRGRLSAADRLLVESRIGPITGRPREERLAARRSAAERLPESAEAQYAYADWLYHYGRTVDIADHLARARTYFERSIALDSQGTVLQHLVEVGFYTRDTVLLRRAFAAYDRVTGGAWDWGMVTALVVGDQAMYAAQRRRIGRINSVTGVYLLPEIDVPYDRTIEIIMLVDSVASANGATGPAIAALEAAIVRGRPSDIPRFLERSRAAQPGGTEMALMAAAIGGDLDSTLANVVAARLVSTRDPAALCFAYLWRDDPTWTPGDGKCGRALKAVRAVRAGTPEARDRLIAAESAGRGQGVADFAVEPFVLAKLWEQLGDLPRALSLVRVKALGFGCCIGEAPRLRYEARLAAMTGDTTGAITALRSYLALRREAEPALIPQRDSVQAELNRLTRR